MVKYIAIFGVGMGVGALITKITLENKYNEVMEEHMDEAAPARGQHVGRRPEHRADNPIILDRTRYNRIARRYGSEEPIDPNDPDSDNLSNEREEDDYNKGESMSKKMNDLDGRQKEPYVINTEEYMEENEFDKASISYYEDDQVLCDENEEVMDDIEGTVGWDNLGRFGDGSDDPEVVYVRNERLEIDFEVIRLSKSYAETVGGFEPENDKRRIRGSDEDD
jgi:hypothetical protein